MDTHRKRVGLAWDVVRIIPERQLSRASLESAS